MILFRRKRVLTYAAFFWIVGISLSSATYVVILQQKCVPPTASPSGSTPAKPGMCNNPQDPGSGLFTCDTVAGGGCEHSGNQFVVDGYCDKNKSCCCYMKQDLIAMWVYWYNEGCTNSVNVNSPGCDCQVTTNPFQANQVGARNCN